MNISTLSRLMTSPWAIFLGVLAGVSIGIFSHALAIDLKPYGDLFLTLLEMCVIPILMTAVIASLGRLLQSGATGKYIFILFVFFLVGMLLASLVGVGAGILGQPGTSVHNNDKDQIALGRKINEQGSLHINIGKHIVDNEIDVTPVFETNALASEKKGSGQLSLFSFFQKIVPNNIINAMAQNNNLAILFFSICLGIALGVKSQKESAALEVIDTLYESFLKIIDGIMMVLPLGLMCLVASQIAQIGMDILKATVELVILIYLSCLVLMSVFFLLIWSRIKGRFIDCVLNLRQTLLVAFTTSSSFAAIPSALKALTTEFKLNKSTAGFTIPLGTAINSPGSVLHFAISSVFIAQLFNVDITFQGYLIIFLGSVFAGMAAAAAPGVVAIAMIAIILEPLQLPVGVTIILLVAIDPIVDPVLTMINVHANCTATVLVSEIETEDDHG